MKNYEIEVQFTDKVRVEETETLKEAIDYMNSFKDDKNIVKIEIKDLDSYEVIGRLTYNE